jgi:ribosomal protein S4E
MEMPKGIQKERCISMKKVCMVFMSMLFIGSLLINGCTISDADRIAKKINAVHDTIKVVITDNTIKSKIPMDKWDELVILEGKYQKAKVDYIAARKANSADSWSILKEMASYGNSILTIIEPFPFLGKYATEVKVASTTIKALIGLF